jgi:hypothetical protein
MEEEEPWLHLVISLRSVEAEAVNLRMVHWVFWACWGRSCVECIHDGIYYTYT